MCLGKNPSIPSFLPLAPLDNVDVQTYDLDNDDAGSKQRWEAATYALGLDLRLEKSLRSLAGPYRAKESPASLYLGTEGNTTL